MSDRGRLRVPRWPDVARAARMMAGVYMERPVPHAGSRTRRVLTWLAGVAFFLSLALYKPLVRYWIDPRDRRRQIIVAIIPHRTAVIPVLRLVPMVALFAAVVLGLPALMPTPILRLAVLVLTVLMATVVALALLTSVVVFSLPYDGKIRRAGPAVPHTQLTASLAASTSPAGMREVRAYLADNHPGQRLTVRARDEHARDIYRSLGLKAVVPGCGRMTGVTPTR